LRDTGEGAEVSTSLGKEKRNQENRCKGKAQKEAPNKEKKNRNLSVEVDPNKKVGERSYDLKLRPGTGSCSKAEKGGEGNLKPIKVVQKGFGCWNLGKKQWEKKNSSSEPIN